MELDALFGGGDSGVDTVDEPEIDEVLEEPADEHVDEPADDGIGWKALALFICGGLVITALVVAFMVWVIEGLVL
ncbi:hypothetical protein SK803_19390 [Lentzea sp. BCCO 10_0856]|uniref:Uncharacterized protein n=1 Tax=Lentzea miocenica TaxID=3095431 RepID=A0ABU4T2K5_9PSEU|nr:hypothetical protein [Lentzea sp. BCCO 10_0856]MDX8032384.1 hypothetical protein [Lentzea sp. BCCO 10_0856]